jgi:hypothetical protein
MSKTLFIHIPRSGGTSIQQSGIAAGTRNIGLKHNILKQMQLDPRAAATINPVFAEKTQKHIPYHYLRREYIFSFDRAFSILRNPWSRLVSFYHYGDELAPGSWFYRKPMSWDDYINGIDSFMMTPNYYWNHPYSQWAAQLDWLEPNRVSLLRYENLKEDINDFFGSDIKLPHVNSSVYKRHYTEYYTQEQRDKVANWFRLDINYFGFNFESGATQNYWRKR